MPEHEEVGLRELVEEIVESQMRHIQPERGAREACAISVIAEVFELNPILRSLLVTQ